MDKYIKIIVEKKAFVEKKKDEDHTLYEISYFQSGISSFCI